MKENNKFVIPIGPQHPALKEPGHFEFGVEGEIVTSASVRLGYVHRGIEKGTEDRNWQQNAYLLERICGICSHIHGTAYSIGVEKLAGVEVSAKANAIRTLIAEMERIHSHILWLGVAAHEGGFDTLFMYSWRDRERIMDLLEIVTGNRVNYSANILGGVKFDITKDQSDEILKAMDYLEERTKHYLDIVTSDETFLGRTRGIGTMSTEDAKFLGAVGPVARASGVARDVRADAPYAAYNEFPIKIQVAEKGDLEARFVVRMNELFDTYRLIRDILNNMPEGELAVKVPRRIPAGETIVRVEAPRGELFYFIKSLGSDKPDRVKVRTPTLPNWGSVLALAVGHKLADMPMLLSGIDPCFSCNDRMIELHRENSAQLWSWDDLRRYGIEYYK
ncbi:MAG: nickel-dependent hydrogenase large subunit [Anaerolineaceae bacterium]|nr:nickel-dependent hydrogenase large subunit [Anaerolineaceae bacterium]